MKTSPSTVKLIWSLQVGVLSVFYWLVEVVAATLGWRVSLVEFSSSFLYYVFDERYDEVIMDCLIRDIQSRVLFIEEVSIGFFEEQQCWRSPINRYYI